MAAVPHARATGTVRYSERLTVSPVGWVLAVLLAASFSLAFGFYLGPWWAVGSGGGVLAVAAAVLVSAATRLVVDERGLRVGRAFLDVDHLGAARPLDATETTRRAGPEADARAYLVLRPYVRTAVEVAVDDAADPVPYWLVSSRRPQQLAAALQRVHG